MATANVGVGEGATTGSPVESIAVRQFFRSADLCSRWGVSRTTVYTWWAELGILDRPTRLGPNTVVWPRSAVLDFERRRGITGDRG